jgi:hypothetical protein
MNHGMDILVQKSRAWPAKADRKTVRILTDRGLDEATAKVVFTYSTSGFNDVLRPALAPASLILVLSVLLTTKIPTEDAPLAQLITGGLPQAASSDPFSTKEHTAGIRTTVRNRRRARGLARRINRHTAYLERGSRNDTAQVLSPGSSGALFDYSESPWDQAGRVAAIEECVEHLRHLFGTTPYAPYRPSASDSRSRPESSWARKALIQTGRILALPVMVTLVGVIATGLLRGLLAWA